jgi:HK97 family phage major capsid protein
MSKEAMELLKQINAKKDQIKQLVKDGKTAEAKTAKDELIDMQDRFNLLCDIEDDDEAGIADKVNGGKAKHVGGEKKPEKADIARAFVNRIVCGLRKTRVPEADVEILDAVTDAMNEDSDEDGGFTVPQDIQTDIITLRRTQDDLEMLVNRESVTTLTGSRVIEVDADSTPWEDVDEGGEFPDGDTPQFKQIKYKIGKKGGILKTTRELLQDTAVNILAYLNKWIAKKSRATRNAAILKKLDEITTGKTVVLEGFDDFKDVFNVKLDASIAASSIILTNQSGFNYLDKLKDGDGNYIVQPDVTDKTKRLLFGVYPIHVVSDKTMKNGGDKSNAEKYPFYIGDLHEAITLFDREKMTIELSTEAGDLWAKDLTGIKVRDRFDVQAVDETAVIKGEVTVSIAG